MPEEDVCRLVCTVGVWVQGQAASLKRLNLNDLCPVQRPEWVPLTHLSALPCLRGRHYYGGRNRPGVSLRFRGRRRSGRGRATLTVPFHLSRWYVEK